MRHASRLAATALVASVVLGGLLALGGVAGAATQGSPPLTPTPSNYYNTFDAGTPNSSIKVYGPMVLTTLSPSLGVAGKAQYSVVTGLITYGDSDVLYSLPFPKVDLSVQAQENVLALGQELYQQNCEACHGAAANGEPPKGTPAGGFPNLVGLGPATIDFWVESGRMPAADTHVVQAPRRPARLDHLQALAVAAFLNSLDPATPYVPKPNLTDADISAGAALFALNCAACHTITGDGDALANNTFAPSLRNIPAYQVAEALRTGPANMPVFTGNLTDTQLRDVVDYVVRKIQHPENPGGLGLGGLGPVGEGFVGLALGVGLLALVGFWVGDRS